MVDRRGEAASSDTHGVQGAGGELLLYDHPTSSNALKVRFLLSELGLRYERQLVPKERPRPAAYLLVNPRGLIPTLKDGELILTESHAILRYLAGLRAA